LILREKGELDSAASELRESVAQLPDDAQGHHLLGTILLKQNDLNGSIEEFRKAIALDPGLTEARASLAQALQKAGRKQESQQVTSELRKFNEEASSVGQAMILVQTAAGYSKKGDDAAAVRVLQEAVTVNPNLTEAQYQLALALRQAGDAKKSEEVLRKVLQMDSDHAFAHLNLGLLLMARNDTAGAGTELEKAVQLAPSLVEAHTALGKLAMDSHDWPTAVREYQAALAWNPQDRAAHRDLALALKASGQTEDAASEMRLAQPASSPQ